MKLKTVKVCDFRHFTDLTVQNIPEAAKLIVLVGPNGCGKSSFLEALHTWYKWTSGKNPQWDKEYHVKGDTASTRRNQFRNDVTVDVHGNRKPSQLMKMLYARSAYRNDPDFRAQGIGSLKDRVSEIRINRLIDNDAAVAKNYQRLVAHAIRDIFGNDDGSMTPEWFRGRILGDIRTAFKELFPEFTIDDMGDPLEDGTFRLTKGASRGYS